ncbi:trigger factor [Ostreibacterium oceani]|uniref:Trigger factor n=1 Tax=Ostreibacterium oceani TaxID=2654998 RepID=A0A6N7F033_9GAMM|nr:trigger factor [Ostreibacterium oceani]MPV85196.1 trigger factor [Ostreibacterium oceani]
MQVKVDILEGLQRKITVEIPADQVNDQVMTKLKKVQKTTKMDGFRKGKVPMKVVEQKYSAAVRQEVLGDLIEKTYGEAIKQEKLTPAAHPSIQPISGFAANEAFVYEAQIEVIPEFDVKGLDSLTVRKPIAKVLAKDVKAMIDTLRKQSADWQTSDEPAAEGDRVLINFTGTIDGEAFDGGSAEDVPVVLGAKQMLPEFESALAGKKTGDDVEATVNFPADYHGEAVAGKTAQFAIQIKQVETPKLPRVDEQFIRQFGIEEPTKENFENVVRENMERELETGIRRQINQQVMQHLVDANDIVVPASMIENEKQRMVQETKLAEQVSDEAQRNKIIEEQFAAPSRRRVLLGLVMGKLFEEKAIRPDAERVEATVERLAATYENPQQFRDYFHNNAQAAEKIYAQVMEEQLIDEILANAEIVEEKKSFDEVMKGENAA